MSPPQAKSSSGERTRLACWRRRPRRRELCITRVLRRGRRNEQARRLRSPELRLTHHVQGCVPTVVAAVIIAAVVRPIPAQTTTDHAALKTDRKIDEAISHSAVDQLIPWLLDEQKELRGIPFSQVISSATGKRVLPIDLKNEADAKIVKQISAALDETLKRLNDPENRVHDVARINEVSSHVEDTLQELLNASPGLSCDFPHTATDKVQRSGYPDLRLLDTATNKVFYLDPKLYAAGSRDSSFRTFYFEPKITTNKVRDDAVHLIVGFEHEARMDGRWRFTRWDVVDLSHFRVKLKAEFQASNRDMYRPEAIVASSAAEPKP